MRRRASFNNPPLKSFLSSIWMKLGFAVVTKQKALTLWIQSGQWHYFKWLCSIVIVWNKLVIQRKVRIAPRSIGAFIHSFIHSFISQALTECLPCVWRVTRCWEYDSGEMEVVPALMDYWGGGEGNRFNCKLWQIQWCNGKGWWERKLGVTVLAVLLRGWWRSCTYSFTI